MSYEYCQKLVWANRVVHETPTIYRYIPIVYTIGISRLRLLKCLEGYARARAYARGTCVIGQNILKCKHEKSMQRTHPSYFPSK